MLGFCHSVVTGFSYLVLVVSILSSHLALAGLDESTHRPKVTLTPTQIERLANSELNFLLLLRKQLLHAQLEMEQLDRLNTETQVQIATLLVGGALMGVPQIVGHKQFYDGIAGLVGSSLVFAGLPIGTKISEALTPSINDNYISYYPPLIELVKQQTRDSRYSPSQKQQLQALSQYLTDSHQRLSSRNNYQHVANFLEDVSIFVSVVGIGGAVTGAPIIYILSIPINGAVNIGYVGLRATGEIKQANQHRQVIRQAIMDVNTMIGSASDNLASSFAY